MTRMQEIMEEMRILMILFSLKFPFFQYKAGTIKGGLASAERGPFTIERKGENLIGVVFFWRCLQRRPTRHLQASARSCSTFNNDAAVIPPLTTPVLFGHQRRCLLRRSHRRDLRS